MLPSIQELGRHAIVPVVQIENSDDAIHLGKALVDGGLPVAEITLRTTSAEASLRAIAASLPDILLGAGTVLTTKQANLAVSAGAHFIV